MHRPDHSKQLAGIQYLGRGGISKACKDAVIGVIQLGHRISQCHILSASGSHGLLLNVDDGILIGVKSGFSSGYGGEGPSAFSYVLQLLDAHNVELIELKVAKPVIRRLDRSALTNADIDSIQSSPQVGPDWAEYVRERDWQRQDDGTLWRAFPHVLPLVIIDPRILDVAISFWSDPDAKLLVAYRRLEDEIRARTGVFEHGTRLFSQVFLGANPKLRWPVLDPAEQGARGQLFSAVYASFRNPRAHREPGESPGRHLAEFLMLNQLFRLESEARLVAHAADSD
jgi:uncharacterized protein Ymh